MSIDLAAALRRRKPDKHRVQIKIRPLDQLASVAEVGRAGRFGLLIDTNVYINEASGNLPAEAEDLIERSLLFHSSVCIAELATGVANADPDNSSWPVLRDHYDELFASIPLTRVVTPDQSVWVEAGLIAGTLSRTQAFQPFQRKECLNDALIFLSAAKAGVPVLTANRDDFDRIQQLAPEGHFIHY